MGEPAPVDPTADCTACGQDLVGAWCHTCGEKRLTGRLRLGDFLREWVRASLGLERGFLRTWVGMAHRPGRTIEEYLSGMRRTHCSPVRFLLWCMLAAILAMAVVDWQLPPEFSDPFMGLAPDVLREIVANQPASPLQMTPEQHATHYAMSMRGAQINALLIPAFFALASLLTFRGSQRTYAEHLVAALYTFAFLSPTMPLFWILARTGPWWDWLLVLPATWGYIAWVMQQFHRISLAESLGRTFAAYLIASFCAMPFLGIYQVIAMSD